MNKQTSPRKKTPEQIVLMEEVQKATEMAMTAVISYLRLAEAPNSEEANALIDKVLEENGCESPEGHIVASGTQGAEPHEKGEGLIAKGTSVVIDIYPRSKETGYFADMSRTICIGAPSEELQKMYDAVLAAQELAISMIKPKVMCVDIQKAVEGVFVAAGYLTSGKGKEFRFAEGFVHSVGHGVGKELHESPIIGINSTDVLEEGDVVTIEPGLYYKNIGGIRLEDMLLVTAAGCQNLTNFPKEFVL